jgi:hypothetical protein
MRRANLLIWLTRKFRAQKSFIKLVLVRMVFRSFPADSTILGDNPNKLGHSNAVRKIVRINEIV